MCDTPYAPSKEALLRDRAARVVADDPELADRLLAVAELLRERRELEMKAVRDQTARRDEETEAAVQTVMTRAGLTEATLQDCRTYAQAHLANAAASGGMHQVRELERALSWSRRATDLAARA